jgi:biopolymer transport protein ExbD
VKSNRSKRKTSTREVLAADVDLTPIMCLFIILVPLLLLSAVFERLSALQVHLPEASTIEETKKSEEGPTGIVELRLLVEEDGLGLEGTLSHDPAGKEKEVYEDVRYDFPIQGDLYDLEKLQQTLLELKQQYPRHEQIVFIVDDKVSYDVIVQAMDTCRLEYYVEEGRKRSRPLFPEISLSEPFSEEGGFEGLRKGTREIDKKLGIR